MTPLSLTEASRIEYAPSQAYFSKLLKRENRPGYFVFLGDSWEINIDHPDFVAMLRRRAAKGQTPREAVKHVPNVLRDVHMLKVAEIKEKIREKEIKNAILENDLQSSSSELCDFALMQGAFKHYIEALTELQPVKIDNLETEISQLLTAGFNDGTDPKQQARKVCNLIITMQETIIGEAKNRTAFFVQTWGEQS